MTNAGLHRPDRDSAEWWAAVSRHELTVQTCRECDHLRWPPRAMCNDCGSLDWDWSLAAGTGTVASWTVTRRPPFADAAVPFVVLLVRLDDQADIFIPGNWDGDPEGADLTIGMEVAVGYEDLPSGSGDSASLLRWRARVG